jgi:hypothetical protein
MQIFWMTLALVPAGGEAGIPISVEESAEILQLAVDAQLTRQAQWSQGVMAVSVKETGANPMSAQLKFAWDGERTFLEVIEQQEQTVNIDGQREPTQIHPYRKCLDGRKEWCYFPTLGFVQGSGPGMYRKIPSSIDVLPHRAWETMPFTYPIVLADTMRRAVEQRQLVGVRLENGIARITSFGSHVYFIDLGNDARIVRLENDLLERSEEARRLVSPHMFIATYDWETDEHGVPYCKKYRGEYFDESDPDKPVVIREVTVEEFTSKVSDEWKRFDLDALGVAKGTMVKYRDAKSARGWRYGVRGSEAKGLQQPDFDLLIDKLKQDGFASPGEKE